MTLEARLVIGAWWRDPLTGFLLEADKGWTVVHRTAFKSPYFMRDVNRSKKIEVRGEEASVFSPASKPAEAGTASFNGKEPTPQPKVIVTNEKRRGKK